MPRPVPTGQNHDRLHHQLEVVPSGWLPARGVASRVSRLCVRRACASRVESRDGRKLELEASGTPPLPDPTESRTARILDCFCLVGVSEQGRCPPPILQITDNTCCQSVVSCTSSPEAPARSRRHSRPAAETRLPCEPCFSVLVDIAFAVAGPRFGPATERPLAMVRPTCLGRSSRSVCLHSAV